MFEDRNPNAEHPVFLREADLARRWRTSSRTLQRWRNEGGGPAFIVIGGSIRYKFSDVLEYEERRRNGGSQGS